MEIMILENKFVFKNKHMIIKEINPPDKLYKHIKIRKSHRNNQYP